MTNIPSRTSGGEDVKRAFLISNINMQPLAAFLKPWEVVCGEYNSILLDLLTPDSRAGSREFGHILCIFDSDSMMGDAFFGDGQALQCESLLSALEAFCAAHREKVIIANTFCFSTRRWLNFADLGHPQSLGTYEARLNERLIAIAKANPNLALIDMGLLFRRHGEAALLSDSFWYLGRIRYSNTMFRSMATMIHQAINAYAGKCKKVLVLDLDNTIWGGILGDSGPNGVALSEDGVGRCYRDFQRALKAVQRTGVLLAICSKNNLADVEEVFRQNRMMVLRWEDFACIRANWDSKPENILTIAESLNLGVDSFLFIDDNPVERELVRSLVSGVTVPEFPARTEDLPAWLLCEIVPEWFGRYAITSEDQNKTDQYRVNQERQELAAVLDLDTFLENLQIECMIHVDPLDQITRIAQMTQKTNQFNLTTRRYEIPDIQGFLHSRDHAIVLLEYKDRFGSEGAVGLAILDYAEARIDTFLLSCRVIGRKVEERILDKVYGLFRTRGCNRIIAEFIPTRKNQQVAEFYDSHGFRVFAEDDGRKIYERVIA